MVEYLKTVLTAQYEAALAMLNDCLVECPPEHWDGRIGKYAFWHVAYHTLCFTDLYLTPNEQSFELRAIHPQGWREFDDEYPSRRFEPSELAAYLTICRDKARAVLAAETQASLTGASGHSRRKISRGELHIYNIRHIQHHTGQLSACLRKIGEHFQGNVLPWIGTA